jgi:segregation and condensation protein B
MVFAGSDFMSVSAALECLLFVADRPVDAQQLARALRLQLQTVQAGLQVLADELAVQERGIRLQMQGDKVRLVTRPDAALAIEEFLNLDLSARLSGAALETLAVIAYRQPVTRAQIEAVRGVECGGVLRTLIQRGLVEEVGRLEGVGRPFLYAITEHFMHHFGITNLNQLPPLEDPVKEILAATMDPLVDGLVSADREPAADADSLSPMAQPSPTS